MSNEQWMKIPYFAKGRAESLNKALTTGQFAEGLDKALFYFATDTKQWVLVDTDKTIHKINSYEGGPGPGPGGEGAVIRTDQLPPILEAKTDALYIVGKTVYSFDGSAFYPTYQVLQDKVIGALPENVTVVEYIDNSLIEAKRYADNIATEAMEYADNTLEKAKQYSDGNLVEAKDYTDAVTRLNIVQGGV